MGQVEVDDGVLVIREIAVTYRVRLAPEQRDTAERVREFHAAKCPVARSIGPAIAITTALTVID